MLRFLGKYSYAIYMFHQAIIITMVQKRVSGEPCDDDSTRRWRASGFCRDIRHRHDHRRTASWWLLEKHFLAFKRAFGYQT